MTRKNPLHVRLIALFVFSTSFVLVLPLTFLTAAIAPAIPLATVFLLDYTPAAILLGTTFALALGVTWLALLTSLLVSFTLLRANHLPIPSRLLAPVAWANVGASVIAFLLFLTLLSDVRSTTVVLAFIPMPGALLSAWLLRAQLAASVRE